MTDLAYLESTTMDEPRTTWHIDITRWNNTIPLAPLANATEDEAERYVHNVAEQFAKLGMNVIVSWDPDPFCTCGLKAGYVASEDFRPVAVAS